MAIRNFFKEVCRSFGLFRRTPPLETCYILSFTFLASFLRFYRLSFYDLWLDEVFSLVSAFRYFDVRTEILDFNFPAYYIFLKPWISLFGAGPFALRSLSALFNVASVYPFFKLSKMVLGKKGALYATAVFVVSPFQVWYSQEVRAYALVTLLSILFVYCLWRFIENKQSSYFAGSLFIFIVSFFADYRLFIFLFFVILLHVRQLNKAFLSWAASMVICAILLCIGVFLPHLELFRRLLFWAPKPIWLSPLITYNNFLFGYLRKPLFNTVTLLFTAAVLVCLGVYLIRKRSFKKTVLAWIVFFPVLLSFFISRAFFSFYIDRYFIFVSPFFYLLIAAFLSDIRITIIRRLSFSVCVGLMAVSLGFYYTGKNEVDTFKDPFWYKMHTGVIFKHPYKKIAAFLKRHASQEDYIFCSNPDMRLPLRYYLNYVLNGGGKKRKLAKFKVKRVCTKSFVDEEGFSSQVFSMDLQEEGSVFVADRGVLEPLIKKERAFWLVTSSWHRRTVFAPFENQFLVWKYFVDKLPYKNRQSFLIDNVLIDKFEF